MQANPLWILFLLTSVVFAYLSMSVNVENEKRVINPEKSFSISIVVLLMISTIVAYLTSITTNYNWGMGVFLGAILFICGIIRFYYMYRLRIKERENIEEE